MMKVYRPLCSDVTLRLAVDISPSYDDLDEDISADADDDEHCHGVTSEGTCQLRDSNKMTTNHNISENNLLRNQNMKHHSRGHNHSCSWYSRHNTPDKTAKDIYNHEHISDTSLDNIQTISLDSEFKRCVEEGGNDFKEDTRDCELVDNRVHRCHQGLPVMDSANENCQKSFNQYCDADLSCCFDSDAGIDYETSQSHMLVDGGCCCEFNEGHGCVDTSSAKPHWRFKDISIDRNDNFCLAGTQLHEADQDEDKEHQMNTYADDVSSGSQEELPIDLDEDIDVIDKMCQNISQSCGIQSTPLLHEKHVRQLNRNPQVACPDQISIFCPLVMRQSMTASCFGEIEDGDIGEGMVQSVLVEEIPSEMSKSIAEEIHDVLLGDEHDTTDSQSTSTGVHELPFSYPFTLKHVGHLFDKSRHHFTTPETKKRTNLPVSVSPPVDYNNHTSTKIATRFDVPKTETFIPAKKEVRPKKCSVSTMTAVSALELEVTHRGLHRFIPRHKDEMNIGIGDPLHVIKECDDLWCEGINLRTGERGIFPAMYANDLNFLEESDDEDEYWKFSMRFLGSVEVVSHKGDETLVHAINKVAISHKGNITAASLSTLEINQYGIRMIDKSKEGHEKDAFSHFFALKNISFCGTHPKDNRYFAFITKHPRDYKFACHVFHGDRPTHRARDALGEAFKRFYQEYMAFTHPTEDIYME